MFNVRHKGDFSSTRDYLKKLQKLDVMPIFHKYGREGVAALASATAVDSGITSESWGYEVKSQNGRHSIVWTNSHVVTGVNIAIILQYGHGTRNGGYVEGYDYINPAIQPVMDRLAAELYREVAANE